MRNMFLAGAAMMALASGAEAALTPVTSQPSALGPMTVVFVFSDAADESTLSWDQGSGPVVLFDNANDPVGTSVTGFGAAGPVDFILDNLTMAALGNPSQFFAGTAVNGVQHFQVSANFADFGVGPLSAAAAAAVAAAGGGGVFVGVEDRNTPPGSDNDFNDLIYYFRSVRIGIEVPTPAALAVFGVGLLGFAAIRRRG